MRDRGPLGGATPEVRFGADGVLTVQGDGRNDTVAFEDRGDGWVLAGVNGNAAGGIPTGKERTLRAVGR